MFKAQEMEMTDQCAVRYFTARISDAPWIVLCNGIGASASAWKGLIEHFCTDYSILYWEYRGLDRAVDISIARHAADLAALMEAEGIQDATVIGWSMGVQVALELFQNRSPAVKQLVLLNGASGGAIREILNRKNWYWVEPVCKRIASSGRFWKDVGPFLARSKRWKSPFTSLCAKMKWLSAELDRAAFHRLLSQWLDLDLRRIAAQVVVLGNHSTNSFLSSVDVEALVIMGNRDPLVSNRLTRKLYQQLPKAKLHCVRGSSHFTMLEYPQTLYCIIDDWMEDQKNSIEPETV